MGNCLRKSIFFPYNDSTVSLDNLTAAYSTFDASINENADNFTAEGLIENFAVRWQGYVKIQTTGQYVFTPGVMMVCASGSMEIRLLINGRCKQPPRLIRRQFNSLPAVGFACKWIITKLVVAKR
jgi:hypothetical protein